MAELPESGGQAREVPAIRADSHAHLELVAAELGELSLKGLLEAYEAEAAACRGGEAAPLILDPGVEAGDLGRRIALLERLAGGSLPSSARIAAGIWPSREALADPGASLAALEAEIARAGTGGRGLAAIGEAGLDYHHMEADPATQRRLFSLVCDLARRLGLPLIVHSREAFRDTLEVLLAEARDLTVIIHCFGYGPAEARAFLDAGFWISFAGNFTYKRAEALREALVLVPLDRLLLETDAPYMNPEPRRGRPSSPFDIARAYESAAGLRGEDREALASRLARNLAGLISRS